MVKKALLITALLASIPCFASGVGYINYERVASEYTYAKTVIREIEVKGNEIQKYLADKEIEFSKIESPVQKKKFEETVRAEMATKEKAFNDFRMKKEDDVYNRIHAVTEKIRLEKGLDAILDDRSVFSGGEDITNILIQRLNSVK